MPRVPLRDLLPRSERLSDAALADEHSFEILRLLFTASPEDKLVLFDFEGIASAGADYLHRTLSPYFASEEQVDDALIGFCPLLTNLGSASLMAEISGYLLRRERVLLVVAEVEGGFHFVQMLGRLDASLIQPFDSLLQAGEMTASPRLEESDTEFERRVVLERLVWHRLATCNRKGTRIYRPTVKPSRDPTQ